MHRVWLPCLSLYGLLLITLWFILRRNVGIPRETSSITFEEFKRHFGSGDLLLVRTRTWLTFAIEKNFRSCLPRVLPMLPLEAHANHWYSHVAIIIQCDDDIYRIMDVNIFGRVLLTVEDWFALYRDCIIAWRKFFCRDGQCVQIHGFPGKENNKIMEHVNVLDETYPSLLQTLLRRSGCMRGGGKRMNCTETTAMILKKSAILPENIRTARWTPDDFRCNVIDKHLTPNVAYFREQIINNKS